MNENSYGKTPLFLACGIFPSQEEATFIAIAELLLENGANPNEACEYKCLNDSSRYYPLNEACEYKCLPLVKLLLNYKANPDSADYYDDDYNPKYTPLHITCLDKSSTCFEEILAHGANPNSKDAEGTTPLHNFNRKWSRSKHSK